MPHLSDDDLDLTGSLGIDFVNTVVSLRTGTVDLLDTPDAFLDWIERAGGSELAALVPADLPGRRTLTVEARKLREALVALFRATADAGAPPVHTAHVVDRALRAASCSYRLAAARDGDGHAGRAGRQREDERVGQAPAPASTRATVTRATVETVYHADGPLAVLTPLAVSAVRETEEADRDRLRECDAPDCGRWFVDTSKGGQRRWCSMARCGNRAKAARYRRRRTRAEG